VFCETKTRNRRGIFAELCDGSGSAVSLRPRIGKKVVKKGRVVRTACFSQGCPDHWKCKHAKSVNDWFEEARHAAELAGGAVFPALGQDADVLLSQQ